MSKRKLPQPKTQIDISKGLIEPLDKSNIPVIKESRTRRGNAKKVSESDSKTLSIGLKEIDEAIFYYFNNVIRPSVVQNGNKVNVPLIYGSQERWSAVQRDGYYRSKEGKIMTPLIMIKRDTIEKNRSLGNKLDANNPTNFIIFEKKYSKKNVYDRFSILTNRVPVKELYGVVIPDYVNITYSCIIFTDYVEQMNKIVESINYASDSYWGDPDKFKFRATINNYTTVVELTKGQDRAVKTTFNIELLGHIIPDTINTKLLGDRKFYSKSRLNFGMEVTSDAETLEKRYTTPERDSKYPFYSMPDVVDESLDEVQLDAVAIFTLTTNIATASSVSTNIATFSNKTILTPPLGYTIDQNSFTVYVNGISINPSHVSVQQSGSNITATFNSNLIGYSITSSDAVLISGKFS